MRRNSKGKSKGEEHTREQRTWQDSTQRASSQSIEPRSHLVLTLFKPHVWAINLSSFALDITGVFHWSMSVLTSKSTCMYSLRIYQIYSVVEYNPL
jgi:hypothetical protein